MKPTYRHIFKPSLILLLVLSASAARAQLDPVQPTDTTPRYATWGSRAAAVTALWNAKMTFGTGWTWGATNENLAAQIRNNIEKGSGLTRTPAPQATANSIYLIPKVSIRSNQLPRALHHLAAALLTYNPNNINAGQFYPSYTDSEGINYLANTAYQRVNDYPQYLARETRSRFDNLNFYLPAVVTPACPAAVSTAVNTAWDAGTAEYPAARLAMEALNGRAGISNAVKWQCFAMRALPPGVTDRTVASGYIEIGHPDGTTREYSDSHDARIVYDYVNGHVYYSPTHYRPNFGSATAPVESVSNPCDAGRTCISPFFEIVQ